MQNFKYYFSIIPEIYYIWHISKKDFDVKIVRNQNDTKIVTRVRYGRTYIPNFTSKAQIVPEITCNICQGSLIEFQRYAKLCKPPE